VYTKWFEKNDLTIYGTSSPFLILTDKGKIIVKQIQESLNLNGNDISSLPFDTKNISEYSLLSMFERAGFQVSDELSVFTELKQMLFTNYGKRTVFFSPYQFFSKSELEKLFPNHITDSTTTKIVTEIEGYNKNELRLFKSERIIAQKESKQQKNDSLKKILLSRLKNSNGNTNLATEIFINDIYRMKQHDFYPFVAGLLGFIFDREAFPPPAGNNNMRYDVMIPDDNYSIPVEVKSPTEEEMLSVKAIRQALENKILLLARKPFKTSFEVSSFALGFKIPNDRSDVYKLIDEVHKVYKINIAIMDIHILIKAAFNCALSQAYYDVSDFKNVKGVISFEN
jgi:hypothetical protein